jgi:hypothetical protein
MTEDSRGMLQRMIERTLAAYLAQVEKQYGGVAVGQRHLAAALQGFLTSPYLSKFVDEAYDKLMDMAAEELLRNERSDPFHRLMVHPLTEVLDDGRLSRDILPNYFSFIHLVLGDAEEELSARCTDICADLRKGADGSFSWDRFYADPRAKSILWAVLVRVAECFRRFDVRRDWFITLMQNRLQAVSLASNAFLPRTHGDNPRPFGLEEFKILFAALFAPVRRLTSAEHAIFREEFNAAPDQIFGRLFVQLTALGAPS